MWRAGRRPGAFHGAGAGAQVLPAGDGRLHCHHARLGRLPVQVTHTASSHEAMKSWQLGHARWICAAVHGDPDADCRVS